MFMLDLASNKVSYKTIENCFRAAGMFDEVAIKEPDIDIECDPEDITHTKWKKCLVKESDKT